MRGTVLGIALTATAGFSLRAGVGHNVPSAAPGPKTVTVSLAAPRPAAPAGPLGLSGLSGRDLDEHVLVLVVSGMVVALMVVFGLQFMEDAVATPEDVTSRLRVPLLGLVPSVPAGTPLALSQTPPSEFTDAYRALRIGVGFAAGTGSTRILAVTSPQDRDGTTTTASNLAVALAASGSRVLLIDANLRRPRVEALLQRPARVGLFHVLVGQARIRDAVQRTADANFYVMTAGRTASNASEVLGSERMKHLLAMLKQGPFDWVIMDAPPVLTSDDTLALAPLVDGLAFVLSADRTRFADAERAVQLLTEARGTIVGAVLNRASLAAKRSSSPYFFKRVLRRAS